MRPSLGSLHVARMRLVFRAEAGSWGCGGPGPCLPARPPGDPRAPDHQTWWGRCIRYSHRDSPEKRPVHPQRPYVTRGLQLGFQV